ncbi:glycosyltransferase [Mesobacillus jeotgali]|uniref:glycosyltransferase n=1 Tax=Mesobacillus jeotgali TaxID=129985 RepID=UPI000C81830D|nr:glycosyltransferase [Mesobacillus jeotgali]
MKVLHVLSSNKLSGAENVVADICMMFNDEYDMAYCSPDGRIRQALDDRDVKFIPIDKLKPSELKRVINYYKPNIIHAHDVRATLISTLVTDRIPVISHLHGNIEDMRKFGLKSFLYMLSTKKVKKVISVSESILVDYVFKKHIESKTVCLRNIIYTPRIEKLMHMDNNNYSFDFAYIGRFTYPKNPQRVAKVASEILKKCSSAKFGIIGDGELRKEMGKIFKEEGVADRVAFTGMLPYPYKALNQAKCMLMCSRFEGTPIAALESMSLGVPIVSTPVDGMLNIVSNGSTGYLHSEDENLVDSVIKLITDERLQSEMACASFKRFDELNDTNNYKEQLRSIYNE